MGELGGCGGSSGGGTGTSPGPSGSEFAFAVMVEGDFDQDLHGGSTAGTVAGELFRAYYGAQPANKTAANP